ncbi:MAG: hypothetical protein JW747_00565 [Candidatus Aminicenantes bacterium]|nr:hypothetical protein [Candidatus Aminicenantes bacterium]
MNEHPADRLSAAELKDWLRDAALNWLAHDGLWFRAVEDAYGMEKAIALDKKAWESFTVIEAKRIMKRLSIPPGGGIPALVRALGGRLYALINVQEVSEADERRCVFRMKACRVQDARKKQGLPDFPCKEVGIVEYSGFARTIDPRIETRCLYCPPDPHPEDSHCAWEFILRD